MLPSALRLSGRATAAAVASLLLSPGIVRAHGIESSLHLHQLGSLNDHLLLQSQFSNGEPTADAIVRLVPPDGKPLELGRTDSRGQLSFALPHGASGDWELQVDGGPGHRDYLEMPVRAGRPDLEQLSERDRQGALGGWLAGLGGLGAAAMLLGLQRIGLQRNRSPR